MIENRDVIMFPGRLMKVIATQKARLIQQCMALPLNQLTRMEMQMIK
jgi:hypothetical protein